MLNLYHNYYETAAMIIFVIGFATLLFNRNLIKKMIGLNIADVAVFIFFVAKGFIRDGRIPILHEGVTDPEVYVNPIPTALMLTGIVVSICMTSFGLALIQKLHKIYGKDDIDEIIINKIEEDV